MPSNFSIAPDSLSTKASRPQPDSQLKQIVGTQAAINVLMGERYKNVTKETAGVLKGEYGVTPAPVDADLQKQVLDGAEPITCRPADLLEPEVSSLTDELVAVAKEQGIELAGGGVVGPQFKNAEQQFSSGFTTISLSCFSAPSCVRMNSGSSGSTSC